MTSDLESRLRAAVHAEARATTTDHTSDSLTAIRARVRTTRRRRHTVAALGGVALVAVAVTTLSRRADPDSGLQTAGQPTDESTPTTHTSPTSVTTTSRSKPTTKPPVEAGPPAAASEPERVLEDGTHIVRLTDIDVEGSTVEFDVLQRLTGDDALAYTAAHQNDQGFTPSSTYIINENPRLRRLPLAVPAQDMVVDVAMPGPNGEESTPIKLTELPAYFNQPGHRGETMFWLNVEDDIVQGMWEFAYIPTPTTTPTPSTTSTTSTTPTT